MLYALKEGGDGINIADVAASFQAAAIDILIIKPARPSRRPARSASSRMGSHPTVSPRARAVRPGIEVFLPPFEYCIDNGAMIAAAADSLQHGRTSDFTVTFNPSLAFCP